MIPLITFYRIGIPTAVLSTAVLIIVYRGTVVAVSTVKTAREGQCSQHPSLNRPGPGSESDEELGTELHSQ